ncbi:homoserine O-acetyltransferase [Fomitopsis serialis]|uniref:homoserine O-acetyltransferase n=1 Tax=Fomitopsis serialis TaxID=139415 RepID=UPI0020073060|nr:homoserine O-acetyltransferase [Neoantrodia serialis]KAH9935340.1 homoserine O-acetyltransferase [Neoantrodia serialis]
MSTIPSFEIKYFHHGRFKVAGGVLPDAVTAYQTFGNPANPCIVFPTCYGAQLRLDSQLYLVGEDKALDPRKYFIVTFALFCNGESSSPSNTQPPYNGPYFPLVSYEDNIRAQYAVLQSLGVNKVYCAIGFSMGGQQPAQQMVNVEELDVKDDCNSWHHHSFLEGPKNAMKAAKDFDDGHYKSTPQHAIRAFGRAYSAWAMDRRYNGLYPTMEAWLREAWEGRYIMYWDANDMIALLLTWQNGDVSVVRDGGDFETCLRSIKAKALIMPCKTDLYFCPEDSEVEVSLLQDARLTVIDSVWGHVAGGSANPTDVQFITAKIKEFLN